MKHSMTVRDEIGALVYECAVGSGVNDPTSLNLSYKQRCEVEDAYRRHYGIELRNGCMSGVVSRSTRMVEEHVFETSGLFVLSEMRQNVDGVWCEAAETRREMSFEIVNDWR